ncbi:SRPBCC domain-containing protein [Yinghuangia aomiensis]
MSKTLPYPAEQVWEFLTDDDGVALWLGTGAELSPDKGAAYRTDEGAEGEVRSYRPLDRVRVTYRPAAWDHDTTVQVAIRAAGAKTMPRFHPGVAGRRGGAGAAARALAGGHWRPWRRASRRPAVTLRNRLAGRGEAFRWPNVAGRARRAGWRRARPRWRERGESRRKATS